jgi:hypothetical protein
VDPKRRRPKTELQLYRDRVRDEQFERRDKLLARAEAQLERHRELRERARDEARLSLESFEPQDRADYRLELHDPERSGMWSGLAVGLGVAALVGVAGVLVYLLVRKKDNQVVGIVQGPVGGLGRAEPMPMSAGSSMPEVVGSPTEAPRGQWRSSVVKSYRLPSLNDKTRGAIRVAQATDVAYEVALRTVSPDGQFAAFSFSATELNTATNPPIGDNIILPTGHWQLMTLRPREVLYAKGSNANVVVSVTMNEAHLKSY